MLPEDLAKVGAAIEKAVKKYACRASEDLGLPCPSRMLTLRDERG